MRYITIVLLTVFVLSACATETEPAREIKLTVLPNPTSDSTATPFPTHTVTPLPTGFTSVPQPTSTPTLLGVIGTLGASPVIEAGNPADWTDYVIEAQVPITINWTGIEPDIYNQVSETTFFYTPDGGTPQMIGVDSSLAGGMSITWTPPSGVSGTITASARTINNAFIDSSRLHIREASESE